MGRRREAKLPPMAKPLARLLEGEDPSRAHALGVGRYVLGRDPDADLRIEHPDVSRRHARLEVFEDGAELVDLDSKNGLRVDGRACTRARLRDGSRVELGELSLTLHHPGERVAALLEREGEVTLRRPRAQPAEAADPSTAAGPAPRQPSLALPLTFAAAFALLVVASLLLP
ncbi:FHA domain containing protein [Plesiocystis pacifica SIR-1]|uniref:FHA domain containing protein n=2 Tax=Plesiocystis pacifica TaxID=191768 RepID=A6G3P8_9BACT|nr:FHA domain containing protein [Plesiocystis pacifica SIR-1]